MSSVCVCVCVCVCACVHVHGQALSCSVGPNSLQPHGLVVCWAPLSMEFSRQEYWNGLPFPPPGDHPDAWSWTLISLVSCIGRHLLYHCTTWDAPGILEEPKKKKKELRPSLQADAFIEEKIRVRNLRGMCGALREPCLTWLVSRTFLCLMT